MAYLIGLAFTTMTRYYASVPDMTQKKAETTNSKEILPRPPMMSFDEYIAVKQSFRKRGYLAGIPFALLTGFGTSFATVQLLPALHDPTIVPEPILYEFVIEFIGEYVSLS